MNTKIWFILTDGQVNGPFSIEEINSQLDSHSDPQIWGRGLPEWMTADRWKKHLKTLPNHKLNPSEVQVKWRVRIEGKEQEPLTFNKLIPFLRGLEDLHAVDVCDENSNQWRDVYMVNEVVDELGITRRNHPRVPIVGTLECESARKKFTCRAISISEGGLGVNGAHSLAFGERFSGTLSSENLFVSFTTTMEVVYVGKDGYAGLKFVTITEEYKNSIIEYVNKFIT